MFRKRVTAGRAAAEGGRHRPGAAPAPAEPAPREPFAAPAPPEPVPAPEPPWAPAPPGLDVSTAHPARIWNYWLGGRDWFPADREAGDAIGRRSPEVPEVARAQRAFLV